MDSIDREIIRILQRDGRLPFTEVAKQLNISEGTVRNRVTRLVDRKAIQFVGLVDPYHMGYDAPAMVAVTVEPPMLEDAAEQIASLPEVSYLVMVSGEFDMIVEVLCKNRDSLATFLNQKLRQIPGITRTQTYLILRTFKMAAGAQPELGPPSGDTPSRSTDE